MADNPPTLNDDSELRQKLAETEYEISVLKGKLDEKQKVNVGVTPTFSFNAKEVKSIEDFVKLITTWGFHRGNWQNFIMPEDLDPWTTVLNSLVHQRDEARDNSNITYKKCLSFAIGVANSDTGIGGYLKITRSEQNLADMIFQFANPQGFIKQLATPKKINNN